MAFPNSMTLEELRTAARQRADMINSDFVTDAEFNQYINLSYFELYDILVQKYGSDYFVAAPYAFSTVADTATVALPEDFYKSMALDVSLGGRWVNVRPFTFGERNSLNSPRIAAGANVQYRINGSNLLFIPTPTQEQQFQLWYVPRLTPLEDDEDVADGVSGWLEFVIVDATIKALNKEESDTGVLRAQKAALIQRIESAAENRDAGEPATVTDTSASGWDPDNFWGF